MTNPNEYLLNRDSHETTRLGPQHELYVKQLGYLIKPSIAGSIPENARIVDIGTGTGVWAIHAGTDRPSAEVIGLDISADQFKPASELPKNVRLETRDLHQPFPDDMMGTFDLVHLRLLILAMHDQQAWISAAKNIVKLLKPGGVLQWEECDFHAIKRCMRATENAKIDNLRKGFRQFIQITDDIMKDVPEKLERAFHEAGLEDVDIDTVTTDRLSELRPLSMFVGIGAAEGTHRQYRSKPELAKKIPGTQEDDDKLFAAMRADAETGGYTLWYIHCFTGRKPT